VFPAVNIYDDGESYLLRAELPGMSQDDLDISAKEDEIIIRGERQLEKPEEDANYHRREREGGGFRRAVTLPKPINNTKVQATYDQGILEIRAPRSERATPKKIQVQ
jgi:HSP20 family protein